MAFDDALFGDDAGFLGGEEGEGEKEEKDEAEPFGADEDAGEAPLSGEGEEKPGEGTDDLAAPLAEPVEAAEEPVAEAEPEETQTELFETAGPPIVPPKPAAPAKKPAPARPAAKPAKAKVKAKKKAKKPAAKKKPKKKAAAKKKPKK